MSDVVDDKQVIWKEPMAAWLLWLSLVLILIFFFYDALSYMVHLWGSKEEYGHGYLIPVLALFFIWQKKDKIETIELKGSWLGLLVVLLGLVMYFAGELASLYVVTQYAFIIVLMGAMLSYMGSNGFKFVLIPLFILFFMIPLPNFLYQNLSASLQLISTQIGVAVIRLMDISVYVEGNVIDLGVYKLQVVEACSGLNYLFPLMTLAFISAYFFTGAFWKKAIIFLSSIPITILMNSFRIGAIGVTVEYWGPEMAEGFLHDFEGWAVFMSCIAILIAEMWILTHIGKDKLPLREAFGLDFPEPTPENGQIKFRATPKPFYASFVIILLVTISVSTLPKQTEIEPDRTQFAEFPLQFDGWQGRAGYLDQIFIDTLKFTDYVMNDYLGEDTGIVNFYSAYYASQKKGASAHSPRSCIPGGGWRITSLTQHNIQGAVVGDVPLEINRLVIQKDETKQLVYYWFQQRGRVVSNEYMMKWWLFWDSINQNRTDGALIRLTTTLKPGQDISIADKRLESFAREITPIIPKFVPGK